MLCSDHVHVSVWQDGLSPSASLKDISFLPRNCRKINTVLSTASLPMYSRMMTIFVSKSKTPTPLLSCAKKSCAKENVRDTDVSEDRRCELRIPESVIDPPTSGMQSKAEEGLNVKLDRMEERRRGLDTDALVPEPRRLLGSSGS